MKGNALKVAALVGVAAILAAALLVLVRKSQPARFYVDYDFSGNVHSGASVRLAGVRVGVVDGVEFLGAGGQNGHQPLVRVSLALEQRAGACIHQDAEFHVSTRGPLGEPYIDIVPGSDSVPLLSQGSTVRGVDPPRVDLILARLYGFLDSATQILQGQDLHDALRNGARLLDTSERFLRENSQEIKTLLVHLDLLLSRSGEVVAKVDQGISDPQQLRRMMLNVEEIGATLNKQLGPLIAKSQQALDGVSELSKTIGPEERKKISVLLTELVAISTTVRGLSADAAAITAALRKGQGTMGALLIDQQVYEDFKALARDLRRFPTKLIFK